jgi:hypothetical protein
MLYFYQHSAPRTLHIQPAWECVRCTVLRVPWGAMAATWQIRFTLITQRI